MFSITASCPTRFDLAGGTLDLWPIHHLLDQKATVNAAIDLNAETTVRPSNDHRFHLRSTDQKTEAVLSFKEALHHAHYPLVTLILEALWNERLPPLTITTNARSPKGAGIGGSSSLAISVCAALYRARQTLETLPSLAEGTLVKIAGDVEARLIKAPTGIQDYWAAIRGGINVLHFPYGNTTVETFAPQDFDLGEMQVIFCYSGVSRHSAINNWEIFKRVFDGDSALIAAFNEIGRIAAKCGQAIRARNWSEALKHSDEEWKTRLQLWPNIETAATQTLSQAATKHGAEFTRVCGAGGGGVMTVFASRAKSAGVRDALAKAGGTVLEANLSPKGLVVAS